MHPTTRATQGLVLFGVLILPLVAGAANEQRKLSPLAFSPFADLAERLDDRSPEAATTLRSMAAYAGKPQYGAVGVHKGTERLEEFAYLTRYQHEAYSGLHTRLRRMWARMTFEGASGMLVNKGGFVVPFAGHVGWISVHLLMRRPTRGFPRYPHALDHLDFASVAWSNMRLALPAQAVHDAPPPDVVAMHDVGLGEGSWTALGRKNTLWDGRQTVLTRDQGTRLEHAPVFELLKPHINGSKVPEIRVYQVNQMEIEALAQPSRAQGARPSITPGHRSTDKPTTAGSQRGNAKVIPHSRLIMARMKRQ